MSNADSPSSSPPASPSNSPESSDPILEKLIAGELTVAMRSGDPRFAADKIVAWHADAANLKRAQAIIGMNNLQAQILLSQSRSIAVMKLIDVATNESSSSETVRKSSADLLKINVIEHEKPKRSRRDDSDGGDSKGNSGDGSGGGGGGGKPPGGPQDYWGPEAEARIHESMAALGRQAAEREQRDAAEFEKWKQEQRELIEKHQHHEQRETQKEKLTKTIPGIPGANPSLPGGPIISPAYVPLPLRRHLLPPLAPMTKPMKPMKPMKPKTKAMTKRSLQSTRVFLASDPAWGNHPLARSRGHPMLNIN